MFRFRPIVYICSPYSGDVEGNTQRARHYCRYAVDKGFIPIAPHLMFPQFMDEETERDLAVFMDLAILPKCAELWVCGDAVSEGMQVEIDRAEQKNMKVRYIAEEEVYVRDQK